MALSSSDMPAEVIQEPGSVHALSAYMLFANEARMQFADPSLGYMDVAKLVLDRWAALSDSERQVYDKRAEELKQRLEENFQKSTAPADADEEKPDSSSRSAEQRAGAGVERELGLEAEKENEAPTVQVTPAKRKRTPTAYALFAVDEAQRSKAAEQCKAAGAETGARHVAVALREMWKNMSDAEKAPYEDLRERARAVAAETPAVMHEGTDATNADTAETQPKLGDETEHGTTSTPAKASSKKRAREVCQGDSTTKRNRAAGKQLQASGAAIDEAVIEEARSLGLESSLKNLASRAEVQAKGPSAQEMLHALKTAEGLVNKAKQLLVGV